MMAVSRRRLTLALLALIGLITTVYWPGLSGGFVFDDYPNLVLNKNLHVTSLEWNDWIAAILSSPSRELVRPLAMLSFAINHYFTGLAPWPMKLTNLTVHVLNALLVFGLARRLLEAVIPATDPVVRERYSIFISACWALMPINLMGVLLVVQRMESLSNAFVLAGLWCYMHGRLLQKTGKSGWSWILSGLILGTTLGTLSKESAALLPLYALMIEVCVLRYRNQGQARSLSLISMFAGLLLIPAILGLAWLTPKVLDPAAYAHRDFTLVQRLITEPGIVLEYFRWTVLPDLTVLSLFHDDYPVSQSIFSSTSTLLGWLLLPAMLAAAWLLRDRRPLASLGILWFLGAHLLTATFIPLELVFEHRNYFASLGVSMILCDLLLIAPSYPGSRRIFGILAFSLVVFYAAITHLRAIEWSDPFRFAQTEVAKHPSSPRATYHYAQTLAILSNAKPDSPFTIAALEAFDRASAVPKAGIAPAQGALLLSARAGLPLKSAWWADLQRRLASRPIGPQETGALGALSDCAVADICKFPREEMVRTFEAALSQGDNAEVISIYGNYAFNALNNGPMAERLWLKAVQLNPTEPQYVASLVKYLIAAERFDEARQRIQDLRAMGRLGQYEQWANELEIRLRVATANASSETEKRFR